MKIVTAIFVTSGYAARKGLWARFVAWCHRRIGGVVCFFTRSRWAHAAVAFHTRMIEALGGGVRWEKKGKYDGEPIIKKIEIPVSDRKYKAMMKEAKKCIGLRYGLFDDCVIGATRDNLGDRLGGKLAKAIDDEDTINCSALLTRIFRAAFPSFMSGCDESEVTPERAYRACLILAAKQKEKHGPLTSSKG